MHRQIFSKYGFKISPLKFYELLLKLKEYDVKTEKNYKNCKTESPFFLINNFFSDYLFQKLQFSCLRCYQNLNENNLYFIDDTKNFDNAIKQKLIKHGKLINHIKLITSRENNILEKNFNKNFLQKSFFCKKCCKKIPFLKRLSPHKIIYIFIRTKKYNLSGFKSINFYLKNYINRVHAYVLNSEEIKEIYRKIWHNNMGLQQFLFKYLNKFCNNHKIFHTNKLDFNSFFLKQILEPNKAKKIKYLKIKNTFIYRIHNIINKKLYKNKIKNLFLYNNQTINTIYKDYLNILNALKFNIDNPKKTRSYKGLKQIMEKKIGLIRNNLMGKRVNYSSRSVVIPDPNIESFELGFSEFISKKFLILDYFLNWNTIYYKNKNKILQNKIKSNNFYSSLYEKNLNIFNHEFIIILKKLLEFNNFCIFCKSFSHNTSSLIGIPFMRKLYDGDFLLANRQPTLHKIGLMCHKIKILKTGFSYSLNYINCKSYNADFDGDEINVHIIQGVEAKSEAINILSSDNHTIVPKDTTLIRYFIQDSLVSAFILSRKDFFLEEKDLKKIFTIKYDFYNSYNSFIPTIICNNGKKALWTGKHFFSWIFSSNIKRLYKLNHFYVEKNENTDEALNVEQNRFFMFKNENKTTIFFIGNFISGRIKISEFEKYGFFEKLHNILGNISYSSKISQLDNILANFTKVYGFTLGINDLLFRNTYNNAKILKTFYTECCFLKMNFRMINYYKIIEHFCFKKPIPVTKKKFLVIQETKIANLKNTLKTKFEVYSNDNFFYKPSTENCLLNILKSGSKGTMKNFNLICNKMGQIITDKTYIQLRYKYKLNVFQKISYDNYFSGLNILNFYFHSFVGRIGILNSVLTTFRSGYLQRSIIKNLESVAVGVDLTLRDETNDNIIDFNFRPDNLDLTNSNFLKTENQIDRNFTNIYNNLFGKLKYNKNTIFQNKLAKNFKAINFPIKFNSYCKNKLFSYKNLQNGKMYLRSYSIIKEFIKTSSKEDFLMKNNFIKKNKNFNNLIFILLIIFSLISKSKIHQFGEYVGVLCGQSICEPLTQLTLNAFHHLDIKFKGLEESIPELCNLIQGLYTCGKKNNVFFYFKKLSKSFSAVSGLLQKLFLITLIKNISFFIKKSQDDSMLIVLFQFYNSIDNYKSSYLHLGYISKDLNKIIISSIFERLYNSYRSKLFITNIIKKINSRIKKIPKKKKKKIVHNPFSKIIKNQKYYKHIFDFAFSSYHKPYLRYIYKIILKNSKFILFQFINSLQIFNTRYHNQNFIQINFKLNKGVDICFDYVDLLKILFDYEIQNPDNIRNPFVIPFSKKKALGIKTQGINIPRIIYLYKYINFKSLGFGNNAKLSYFLGIEAVYSNIYFEIISNLSINKITLNVGFIKIIPAYMTHKGYVVMLNRFGMNISNSYLQNMSLECGFDNFKNAIGKINIEKTNSPSASLSLGDHLGKGTSTSTITNINRT